MVTCPELQWPSFQKFQYIPLLSQCWDSIQPSFKLYSRNKYDIIGNQPEHLRTIKFSPLLKRKKVSKLVVIIHGYLSDAKDNSWVDKMARETTEHDKTEGLYVMTVDWGKQFTNYTAAAASTIYVGVATERIVKQLDPEYIHCIGHSLGAHTCGFLGKAIQNDTSYKKTTLDRITALDPANDLFFVESDFSRSIIVKINVAPNERLDKSDASKVDVLHTDSGWYGFGATRSLGHADFYIGTGLDLLGEFQHGCSYFRRLSSAPWCHHSRSHELMMQSIQEPSLCWAQLACEGQTVHRGCVLQESCQEGNGSSLTGSCVLETPAQFGYWWNGEAQGNFGVILKSKVCNKCPENSRCSSTSNTKTTTTKNHDHSGKVEGGIHKFHNPFIFQIIFLDNKTASGSGANLGSVSLFMFKLQILIYFHCKSYGL